METAPKGVSFMAQFREWGSPSGKVQVQPAMWLCDRDGQCWTWREPYRMGTTVHADAWMTFEEFEAAQIAEGFENSAIKNKPPIAKPAAKPAPAMEFDL